MVTRNVSMPTNGTTVHVKPALAPGFKVIRTSDNAVLLEINTRWHAYVEAEKNLRQFGAGYNEVYTWNPATGGYSPVAEVLTKTDPQWNLPESDWAGLVKARRDNKAGKTSVVGKPVDTEAARICNALAATTKLAAGAFAKGQMQNSDIFELTEKLRLALAYLDPKVDESDKSLNDINVTL